MEGDVSAGARFKGGEGHVGGLGNGYCIPDTPYKHKTLPLRIGIMKYANDFLNVSLVHFSPVTGCCIKLRIMNNKWPSDLDFLCLGSLHCMFIARNCAKSSGRHVLWHGI